MNILAIPASLRTDSFNRKLLAQAITIIRREGHIIDLVDLREYDMPAYSGDLESAPGIPPAASQLGNKMKSTDAIIISSPEYNYSYPGFFKNIIDWISRIKPYPWAGKPMMLLSASPGAIGGQRSLWHLRQPLEACSGIIHPDMFSLALAHQAFDESGRLKDAKQSERLDKMVTAFLKFAENVANLSPVSKS